MGESTRALDKTAFIHISMIFVTWLVMKTMALRKRDKIGKAHNNKPLKFKTQKKHTPQKKIPND